MEQEESAYITSLHLKGYKSIRDVSVTLNKGLNILIGANGSGKTNFLEFLDAAYRSDYKVLLNGRRIEVEMTGKPYSIKKLICEKILRDDRKGFSYKIEKTENNNVETILLDEDRRFISIDSKTKERITINFYQTLFLRFENPLSSILKEKFSLTIHTSKDSDADDNNYFIYSRFDIKQDIDSFLNKLFANHHNFIENNTATVNQRLKGIIENQLFPMENLEQNLRQFSPIKNIKIDWSATRYSTASAYLDEPEDKKFTLIEGIDFQFYVNNEWINWTQLSDGTKRLFYLIGSVTYAEKNEIILIEEPELGVHPHQLALLMNFLKSQSRDKQIIISTHSPQVLNCLGEEELDRIIVARHEGKAGTKLYHLSEREQKLASEFMINEAFLSDYWMLSGFMNEEMPEEV